MRRVLFASTLFAVLGSLVATSDRAHANDFVCIRTSKGKITCGSVIRSSNKASPGRLNRRQHLAPAPGDERFESSPPRSRRSAGRNVIRTDDIDSRTLAHRNRHDRDGYRRRSSGTAATRYSRSIEKSASVEMPRPNPLRPVRSEPGRPSHPKRIVFRKATQGIPIRSDPQRERDLSEPRQSRRDVNFSPVPPGRNASREEILRSIDRALGSGFEPNEQPPSELTRKEEPPSAFARKEQAPADLVRKALPRRVVYPDMRPYRDDARQPRERSGPHPDDGGKGQDEK